MTTARRTVDKKTGVIAGPDDAENPRSLEHPDAEKVRNGEMSAARIGGNNVPGSDEIALPGYVETAAAARAKAAAQAAEKAK